MRELERHPLERHPQPTPAQSLFSTRRVAIVGRGRLGNALAIALRKAGLIVDGPLGRGAAPTDAEAVLLCVPDAEIAAAGSLIGPGGPVGHCSGATGLEPLAPHEAFSLHPLMTVTTEAPAARLRGAGAAVAGSTPAALELAIALARALGMRPVQVAQADRAAYHAAASIASNFLITLEAAAERLALSAGVDRELLVPLVRATVENWARLGPERALTGPVARGDQQTVARQRAAVYERAPELVALFDALVDATQNLVQSTASIALGHLAEPVEATASTPLGDLAEPVEATASTPLGDSPEANPPGLDVAEAVVA
jgi:predicted short-subunit dehydrogenase-like oxidoreductase (DUF2520 family)